MYSMPYFVVPRACFWELSVFDVHSWHSLIFSTMWWYVYGCVPCETSASCRQQWKPLGCWCHEQHSCESSRVRLYCTCERCSLDAQSERRACQPAGDAWSRRSAKPGWLRELTPPSSPQPKGAPPTYLCPQVPPGVRGHVPLCARVCAPVCACMCGPVSTCMCGPVSTRVCVPVSARVCVGIWFHCVLFCFCRMVSVVLGVCTCEYMHVCACVAHVCAPVSARVCAPVLHASVHLWVHLPGFPCLCFAHPPLAFLRVEALTFWAQMHQQAYVLQGFSLPLQLLSSLTVWDQLLEAALFHQS